MIGISDLVLGNFTMDRLDGRILFHLQKDGQISMARLSEAVGLSLSACHRRVKILEAEGTGFLDWLQGILDDLGIGFGWAALYLTIIQAWWKGSSVGKKMFRIRIVMIDKRPLNLWLSFERVGGYAAGLATGMLGFALALSLEPQMNRELFLTMTYVVVVFSIIGQGLTIGPLIKRILSKTKVDEARN